MTTRVRHVTAIVLPETAEIVDVVVGDAAQWDGSAAAHLAFVRPLVPGARSNVILLTTAGTNRAAARGRAGRCRGGHGRARQSWRAAERIPAARSAATAKLDADREAYPRQARFDCRWPAAVADYPWMVEGMWHDGRRTYLRTRAIAPVLYERVGGELAPVTVSTVVDDVLHVVPRVPGAGALEVGGGGCRGRSLQGRRVPLMASWKQRLAPPAGALPGNLITKAGVGVIAVLLAGLVLRQSGGEPETEDAAAGEPQAAGQGVVGQLRSRLTQLAEQRQSEEQSRARRAADAAAGTSSALPPTLPLAGAVAAAARCGNGSPPLQTAGGVELRERLCLEALERRTRSLRAPSVVQTFRSDAARQAGAGPDDPAGRETLDRAAGAGTVVPTDGGEAAIPPSPDAAAIADRMQDANAALLAGLAGGATDAGPPARTVPGVTGPPVGPAADPVVVQSPADPAGWERGYEGSVLVT